MQRRHKFVKESFEKTFTFPVMQPTAAQTIREKTASLA
jgi:hypothetical protein